MASKYIIVMMAICAAQSVQSAAFEKRGLLDSIPFIGPILQQAVDQVTTATNSFASDTLASLAGGVTQAETMAQNYTDQAAVMNDAAKGPLETILKVVTDEIQSIVDNSLAYGWNSTLCVAGQKENTEDIVRTAATNIFGCTQTAIQETFELLSDVTNLNNQGIELARSIPGDIYTLTAQGIQLPDKLTACSAEQILKATADVGRIITNAGVCIKQVAQNS